METFKALWTVLNQDNKAETALTNLSKNILPENEVQIRVTYSSLNYKDALSANGHKGITRNFPHIPGIDAVGHIVSDNSGNYQPGEEVIVTGFDLGMNTHGGLAEFILVPANWVIRKPKSLSELASMQWGTAGLTAAMAVEQLQKNDIYPTNGPILVTGATGGVGMVAIMLLVKLGYSVSALTRKTEQTAFLEELGVKEVIAFEDFMQDSSRALYPQVFAGAIDALGGEVLVKILKSLKNGGAVAACGMANEVNIPMQIYPFILRGAKLLGIYSADAPLSYKQKMWDLISGDWQLDLSAISTTTSLEEAPIYLNKMLHGQSFGRVVVAINS